MMFRIKSWCVVAAYFVQHILYKVGLAKKHPSPEGKWDEIQSAVGDVLGWNKYIRTHNTHLVPRDHPAIFYGNHMRLDDPFYLFRAIYLATAGRVKVGAMLRNDFFANKPYLKTRFLDLDEVLDSLYVYGVSRENVTVSQLKRFVDLLLKGRGFILYPGRSRTCSGMLVEYRDAIQRPGGISFFLHATQGRDPNLAVSAVPAVRNYNPVTEHTSVIFGPEQVLPRDATREQQREFDEHLITVLGPLVEINVAQLVALTLYLRCLHGIGAPLTVDELEHLVAETLDATDHPHIDPEDAADVHKAVRGALRYFNKHGMIAIRRGEVIPDGEAILTVPSLTIKFREENPVRFLANQILHLPGVIALIERRVLASEPDSGIAEPPARADKAS